MKDLDLGQLQTSSALSPPLPRRPGDHIHWGQLAGSAMALAIASSVDRLQSVGLVIATDSAEAARLEQDIRLYLLDHPSPPEVLHFPDWETLPYDTFSPHQDIVSERMRTLYQLGRPGRAIIVVSAATLVQRIAPRAYIESRSFVVSRGDLVEIESFRTRLTAAGYQSVDTVFQHGEFAVRGSLLDIYPMGSSAAYRIELFDNEVESVRTFDPETQRSVEQVQAIELLPARECPLDRAAISVFKNRWHEFFEVDARQCPVYQDVVSGLSPAGVEYFLPLFFEQSASFFDYLPANTVTFVTAQLEAALEKFWREACNRYDSRKGDIRRPILKPEVLFLPVNEVFAALKPLERVTLSPDSAGTGAGRFNFQCSVPPELFINAKLQTPLVTLQDYLKRTGYRVLFCAESMGRREALLEQLASIAIKPVAVSGFQQFRNSDDRYGIAIAAFEKGAVLDDARLSVVAEPQLFGLRIQARRRQRTTHEDQDNLVKNLTELKVGAPVVHIENGVGRYLGLQTLQVDKADHEFLVLQYAGDAKLYVPVTNLHFISRYSGTDPDLAPLHRLGSEQWQRAKRKAAEEIRDVAAELLDIYARRAARLGTAFDDPREAYEQFSAAFPFEETPDQRLAIEAVRDDLLSPRPMDRLVCGDVGFGKTEVAMRAAFIAVQNSRQVVVLVPTTLLAQQHFENFKDRFADFPVNVEVISRFRSIKETASVRQKVEKGAVDILIGTHKLLQGEFKYPNLGLLIIDEEHRFGVRQKEALKALRAEVDILTLTATPIPRTLNMAMNGIRDLSIIATPPARRLSVKTFVREADTPLIKEAILREIMRGGQVYFLHNEVKDIQKRAAEIGQLVPEARIQIAHGQMRERELEAVMSDFYHKRFNLLVCTTIIETGIDVPSANTIIIDRADKLGLAQLHQLRGRVGRSHHQAYAYLLTPNVKAMTDDAQKRLAAIEEAQDLGAGFMLASHDLEIRGAGELLGDEQSGQMQAIGFSLYMDMLDRAVKAIKKGEVLDLDKPLNDGVEIDLHIPALIPSDYLPDVHSRLILYKRLASLKTEAALDELQVEMIDRFGLLPEPLKNLVSTTRLKLRCEPLGIAKLEANQDFVRIEFGTEPRIDPLTIVTMVQKQPQKYRLEGATRLRYTVSMQNPPERLAAVLGLLNTLDARSGPGLRP